MGLDLLVCFDNNDEIYSNKYFDEKFDHLLKLNLSRTFCDFICRKELVNGEPELDQIGKITSLDISPIYEMENYGHYVEIDAFLENAETEDQKQNILNLDKANKEKLKGNIDKVINTITKLIDKLSQIHNLQDLLNDNGWDSLDNKIYFADFNKIKEQDYTSNNFGQDLRNLKRFLEYAKGKGSKTVYFSYV